MLPAAAGGMVSGCDNDTDCDGIENHISLCSLDCARIGCDDNDCDGGADNDCDNDCDGNHIGR